MPRGFGCAPWPSSAAMWTTLSGGRPPPAQTRRREAHRAEGRRPTPTTAHRRTATQHARFTPAARQAATTAAAPPPPRVVRGHRPRAAGPQQAAETRYPPPTRRPSASLDPIIESVRWTEPRARAAPVRPPAPQPRPRRTSAPLALATRCQSTQCRLLPNLPGPPIARSWPGGCSSGSRFVDRAPGRLGLLLWAVSVHAPAPPRRLRAHGVSRRASVPFLRRLFRQRDMSKSERRRPSSARQRRGRIRGWVNPRASRHRSTRATLSRRRRRTH